VKVAGIDPQHQIFTGPARVFECEEEAFAAVQARTYQEGEVLVIRNEGPSVALITDGRFSGATRGFCVGHVGPEAAHCGPIALVQDGDMITIDAIKGDISIAVSDDEMETRKAAWAGPRETIYATGALWKYAQQVGATYKGAVTHPGGAMEKHMYPDL